MKLKFYQKDQDELDLIVHMLKYGQLKVEVFEIHFKLLNHLKHMYYL